MTVNKYTPSKIPVLHAVLWTGKLSCLESMPEVEDLLENSRVNRGNSDLTLWWGSQYQTTVRVGKDYIVRGVTGHFFIVEKERFAESYRLVENSELGE